MDPLFERRELTKTVHLSARTVHKSIEKSLLTELRLSYEARCLAEGYIERNSITVVQYSFGKINYTRGGIDYNVRFQADICMPHVGQKFKAPVKLRSKIGIHAETPPIKVLLPRDLHFDNPDFDTINDNEEVEFEVIGTQFKQQDDTIVVVGKLLTKVKPDIEQPLMSQNVVPDLSDQPLASTSSENASDEKRVVVTAASQPQAKTGIRRKLKKATDDVNTNEHVLTL
jgi:DNA-directed RNA polymerase subunit E'/Rpb7